MLIPGEHWTDAVFSTISASPEPEQEKWAELFEHAMSATTSRPSKKWLTTAQTLIDSLGIAIVASGFQGWLPLVRDVSNQTIIFEDNAICLRGLLWMTPLLAETHDLTREVSDVAISAFKKLAGVGPRSAKVGNAAIYALSQFNNEEAIGQLAIIKMRIKGVAAQKEIEKALTSLAGSLGMRRDEIEEIGVPNYGLRKDEGERQKEEFLLSRSKFKQHLGDYFATVITDGSEARLDWEDANGKRLKSVPAKVRKEHPDQLKELKQTVRDIQKMLAAQRDRIDSLFLSQKEWSYRIWQERYLDHPLVRTIASRLIWCVDDVPVIFLNDYPTDVNGHELKPGDDSTVTMWHPVGRDTTEVIAWRERLEEFQIKQPFKQAHREVYLLTDAERRTEIYSNRFAAHILRQHQFNALCAARGWKNKLRLMVDDFFPSATKLLPEWNLRAEFWVEGIGDEWGTDTNDSGVFLRLASDQVRFYRADAADNYAHAGGGGYENASFGTDIVDEPVPLEEIPPLVFSEVMRDVDLFVGVSSVGNDPTWSDGGPDGRFRDYWESYSFGELSGTAKTRKAVLEKLVPRLKISQRCSFEDRFLIVRGDVRTYKIHLGSGNILMKPNDQYLCIVPDSRKNSRQSDLFLPFEGDQMLSIILSKALLLAEDTRITDSTILSQIRQ